MMILDFPQLWWDPWSLPLWLFLLRTHRAYFRLHKGTHTNTDKHFVKPGEYIYIHGSIHIYTWASYTHDLDTRSSFGFRKKIKITAMTCRKCWNKNWKHSRENGSSHFPRRQTGLSLHLSGLSPFMLRWCLRSSQFKLVRSACFLSHQDRSSLLGPSAGLLVLGHRPNQVLCCCAASSSTKLPIMHEAKFVSPCPFMYAIRADSLSM